jgi:hypothetical protein
MWSFLLLMIEFLIVQSLLTNIYVYRRLLKQPPTQPKLRPNERSRMRLELIFTKQKQLIK